MRDTGAKGAKGRGQGEDGDGDGRLFEQHAMSQQLHAGALPCTPQQQFVVAPSAMRYGCCCVCVSMLHHLPLLLLLLLKDLLLLPCHCCCHHCCCRHHCCRHNMTNVPRTVKEVEEVMAGAEWSVGSESNGAPRAKKPCVR